MQELLKTVTMPITNDTRERSCSGMNHIKIYLRNTPSGNKIKYCMMSHIYCDRPDKIAGF